MRRHPEFGNSWWAKRWRSVLESFGWSSRLQSGRIYARLGNVTRVVIDKGIVMAEVSGSQARPYRVTIKVKTLAVFDWNQVIDKLLERPLFMAKLLAGEMPSDIHEAFSDVHLSLFPDSETDFQTNCSCPDWANPCKHIAAVYYKVGQAFDENPFLIFALRGMGKSEILARLRERWTVDAPLEDDDVEMEVPAQTIDSVETLLWESVTAGTFWSMGPEIATTELHLHGQGAVPRTLPMVWGPPHFIDNVSPRAGREMVSLLADILQSASVRAKTAVLDNEDAPKQPS